MVGARRDHAEAALGTPLEERVFEYARGASAARPEQTETVIQQVIDLAHGDIEILHRARWYCDNFSRERSDDADGDEVLALLEAAIEKTSRERESVAGSSRPEQPIPLSPKLVVALALLLVKEDLHVSVAEDHLIAAVAGDLSVLEAGRTLALEEFAAGLAAGETRAITALSILEGASRRVAH